MNLRSRWLGLVLALLAASCARSADDFCKEWVEQSCQALAGCCVDGLTFDPGQCEQRLTTECRTRTLADFTKDGLFSFDADAARDCLPPISSCGGFVPAPEATFAHSKACANMFDGAFALGNGCGVSDFICARAGEHATCYLGINKDSPGVCAAVVLDGERCAFSRADNTLHVCPDEKFCDLHALDPDIGLPLTAPIVEFSAPCRDRIPAGGSCVDPHGDTDLLPCAKGLFCEVTGSGQATCTKKKPAFAPCSSADACEADLFCPPAGEGFERTCRRSDSPSLFCVSAPPRCGDTICQASEDAFSCPEDCELLLSCTGCACVGSPGGCLDVCGTTSISLASNLCGGHLASGQCAACVETICGFDVGSCQL